MKQMKFYQKALTFAIAAALLVNGAVWFGSGIAVKAAGTEIETAASGFAEEWSTVLNTYQELQDKIDSTGLDSLSVTLTGDVTMGPADQVTVPADKEVMISGDSGTDMPYKIWHDPSLGAVTNRVILNNGVLTLDNVVITGGKTTGNGGGIDNMGALYLNAGAKITGNTGGSGGGAGTPNGGGGVYNPGGSLLYMEDGAEISGNLSNGYGGGGVDNFGAFYMEGGVVGPGNSANYGAGIYNFDGGIVEMSGGSKVSGNANWGTFGAGICSNDHTKTGLIKMTDDAEVSGNIQTGSQGGGGVYCLGPMLMSGNSKVKDNGAMQGGGIYLDGGSLTMEDSAEISSNIRGSGIYSRYSTVTMKGHSSVSGNIGIGVQLSEGWGSFTMEDNAEVSGNSTYGISNGTYTASAGDIRPAGTVVMQGDSKVWGNTMSGVYNYNSNGTSANFTMKDRASIQGNGSASSMVGGLYNSNGTAVLQDDTKVSDNSGMLGGGIYNGGAGADLTMKDRFELSGNNATVSSGGGVYSNGTVALQGSAKITGNTSAATGGGVFLSGGTFTASDSAEISGNTAAGDGGGVYVTAAAAFNMGGSIKNNTSSGDGGGVYAADSLTLSVPSSVYFEGNTAHEVDVPENEEGLNTDILASGLVTNVSVSASELAFFGKSDLYPYTNYDINISGVPQWFIHYTDSGELRGTGPYPLAEEVPHGEDHEVLGYYGNAPTGYVLSGWQVVSGTADGVVIHRPGNILSAESVTVILGPGDTLEAGDIITPSADLELAPLWALAEYTVKYQPGAHGAFEEQVTEGLHYGDDTPAPPTVSGEGGWTFDGWSPAPEATVTGDAAYVAQWVETTTRSEPPESTTATTTGTKVTTSAEPPAGPTASTSAVTPAPAPSPQTGGRDDMPLWLLLSAAAAVTCLCGIILGKKRDPDNK